MPARLASNLRVKEVTSDQAICIWLRNPKTTRAVGLRFDSHLKEGIGIDSNVVLQNPTHAQRL